MQAIQKLKANVEHVRNFKGGAYWYDGKPLGVLLPDSWYAAMLTSNVIALVALFDDSLEEFIVATYQERPRKFVNRIEFLTSKGCLNDVGAVERLKNRRDSFAHDSGVTATWADWDESIRTVEDELRHLGLMVPP